MVGTLVISNLVTYKTYVAECALVTWRSAFELLTMIMRVYIPKCHIFTQRTFNEEKKRKTKREGKRKMSIVPLFYSILLEVSSLNFL